MAVPTLHVTSAKALGTAIHILRVRHLHLDGLVFEHLRRRNDDVPGLGRGSVLRAIDCSSCEGMGFPRGVSLLAEGLPLTVVAIPHVVHADVHLLHRSFSPEQLLAHQLRQRGSDILAGYLFLDVLHWHHRDRFPFRCCGSDCHLDWLRCTEVVPLNHRDLSWRHFRLWVPLRRRLGSRLIASLGRELITRLRRRRKVRLITWLHISWRNRNWVGRILRYRNRGIRGIRNYRRIRIVHRSWLRWLGTRRRVRLLRIRLYCYRLWWCC